MSGKSLLTPQELVYSVLGNTHHNFFDPEDERYNTSAVVVDQDGRGSAGVDVENVNYTTGFWAISNAVNEGLQNGAESYSDVIVMTDNPDYHVRQTELGSLEGLAEDGAGLRVFKMKEGDNGFDSEDYEVVYDGDRITLRSRDQVDIADEPFVPYDSFTEISLDQSEQEIDDELIEIARDSFEDAHAHDSGFRVGSALMTDDGTVYPYSNKESEDRKLTAHSEDAFAKAIRYGERPGSFEKIAIATEAPEGSPPCANCLQTMIEFQDYAGGEDELEVILAGTESVNRYGLSELYPVPFSKGNLEE
jgi:cytidine deaminase